MKLAQFARLAGSMVAFNIGSQTEGGVVSAIGVKVSSNVKVERR